MMWDDELKLWKATQSFVNPGTHTYQVRCGKGGYISSSGNSTFYLSQIANVILRKKASSNVTVHRREHRERREYEFFIKDNLRELSEP